MKSLESTCIIFDWKQITISKNLEKVFLFLMGIDEEIKLLLDYNNKLNNIREKFIPILNDLSELAKVIVSNNIPFQFQSTKKDMTIIEDFELIQIPRSQMVALFAYMETILCLITIYDNQLDNEREIMEQTKNNIDKLINNYILTDKNYFYNADINKFKKINSKQLKGLRNSLTHFYWVSETVSLIPNWIDTKIKIVEDMLDKDNHNHTFLTPDDLYWLLKGAVKLILDKRSNHSQTNSKEFKIKIEFVMSIVEKKAPVLMQLNL